MRGVALGVLRGVALGVLRGVTLGVLRGVALGVLRGVVPGGAVLGVWKLLGVPLREAPPLEAPLEAPLGVFAAEESCLLWYFVKISSESCSSTSPLVFRFHLKQNRMRLQ